MNADEKKAYRRRLRLERKPAIREAITRLAGLQSQLENLPPVGNARDDLLRTARVAIDELTCLYLAHGEPPKPRVPQ